MNEHFFKLWIFNTSVKEIPTENPFIALMHDGVQIESYASALNCRLLNKYINGVWQM